MGMRATGVTIERIAEVALEGESRLLRGMVMALLRENPDLSEISRPRTEDKRILATAASLLELFAERRGQSPPAWTEDIAPLPEPLYLVEGIGPATTKQIRRLADSGSPEPLRKRNLFATHNYLRLV